MVYIIMTIKKDDQKKDFFLSYTIHIAPATLVNREVEAPIELYLLTTTKSSDEIASKVCDGLCLTRMNTRIDKRVVKILRRTHTHIIPKKEW